MRSDRALPWYVFSVFVVLTLLATSFVWQTTRDADRARFDNAVQLTRDAIDSRLDTYINVLTATRGLMASDPALPLHDLRDYIRSHEVQRRYPGIQGIGLTLRVPTAEVPRLEAEMRRDGFADFHVWPRDESRPEVYATVLIEPMDRRNKATLGYDMFSSPVRREAMIRARDTGLPSASGHVTLMQEIDSLKQPGILIYTPVYTTGTTPATVAERRAALTGFIYAPFRAYDLLHGIFGSQVRTEIGFEISDRGRLLYRSGGLPRQPRFIEDGQMKVAGRMWDVRFISRREGSGAAFKLAAATLVGGLVIATLLFMLLRVQLQARAGAERTAERLRTSEAELLRANRAKDEFLATLSHELRTPMTSIMGWAQMLGEDLDPETTRIGIDAINKGAKAQAQLIDDLLDVSRITVGKMHIDPQPMELAPVIAAAMETVRAAADAKGVKLSVNLDERMRVNGDPHRLQQVVWNLLTNAVKFTPAGGEVFVSLASENRDAVIEVRDNGEGIDAAFMPYLFDRFRQADSSATRAHMGLGLGLAIVRHLVELHGGTIQAESRGKGKGATFRVRLPLLRAEEDVSREPAPEMFSVEALRGLRVVVVDDEEDVRIYVAMVLRSSRVEVRCAQSAREALDVLEEWPADVVLTDLAMPRADGFDLLHWIRESRFERVRRLPVVALTAFAMNEDRERVSDAGFQGFLAKPVEPSQLRAAVARAAARVTATTQ
ncbi:MAG TPA: CHASE domain-containing protein [Thermoanaerobaculia bacterium]|jgi:signal transduction histidine kinase/CheY-like chemotaxis protein|nr:CHASE domain-containing protein [Thermoanaerobaculia bacterium]